MRNKGDAKVERVPITLDGQDFDGVVVKLTKDEVSYAQNIVIEGNQRQAYIKVYGKEADLKHAPYNIRRRPDFKLYENWYKYKIGQEIVINSEVILKKIALALHVDANDLINPDGTVKNLKDISSIARSNLKMTVEYDKEGNPTKVKAEMSTYKDVLDTLLKMSTIDNELVKTLVAQIAQPEININRQ